MINSRRDKTIHFYGLFLSCGGFILYIATFGVKTVKIPQFLTPIFNENLIYEKRIFCSAHELHGEAPN